MLLLSAMQKLWIRRILNVFNRGYSGGRGKKGTGNEVSGPKSYLTLIIAALSCLGPFKRGSSLCNVLIIDPDCLTSYDRLT